MRTYAVSTVLLDGLSTEEVVARIAEGGFRELELSGRSGEAMLAAPAEARRVFESYGVVPMTVHTPPAGWNNGTADLAARNASLEIAAATFSQAAEIGAGIVICHSNAPSPAFVKAEYDANWHRSRDSLAILADRARSAGVKIAVENLPARGQPRPSAKMGEVLELIDGLGEHVGICLDAGHSNTNGVSAASDALEANEKLFALHIQDNDGGGEDQHLLPGKGPTDWAAFLDALEAVDFCTPRTFEVIAHDEDAQVVLAALVELRKQWESR